VNTAAHTWRGQWTPHQEDIMFRTHHDSAGSSPRRPAIMAGALAAVGILLAGLTSLAPAGAATSRPAASPDTTTGPTVYEQTAYNQDLSIAADNVHTIVSSSPVLAEGTYEVNSVISFNNLTAGSQVLCGWTTSASGDELYYNYGDAENQDATASTGSCAVTGIAKINSPDDHLSLWATVYSGPAGPAAYSWSINETPVGKAVVSQLT
jgi:hypothetical protein